MDLTTFTAIDLANFYTVGVVVITALAGIWATRKIIGMLNKS